MSEAQMDRYHNLFPFLREKDNVVLSSVFDEKFFYAVKNLREKYKSVERKGWIVHPQVGVSAYRIDLGIVHPDMPGVYLAGVECDGAM